MSVDSQISVFYTSIETVLGLSRAFSKRSIWIACQCANSRMAQSLTHHFFPKHSKFANCSCRATSSAPSNLQLIFLTCNIWSLQIVVLSHFLLNLDRWFRILES